MEYKIINVAELKPFVIRGIRDSVIRKLKERIENGYNPARPLSVVKDNGNYIVADGNHRLQVLNELGIKEVPCVVRDGDPYNIAVLGNGDEDTYAPMDLFDWLDIINKLKGEGLTQAEIGGRIGWSEGAVKQYGVLLNKIVTDVLNLAKQHQKERVTKKVTTVTFDFTEGWFRNSGLYDLTSKYQEKLMQGFIADGFNWNKNKIQSQSQRYKLWQEMIGIAKEALHNKDDIDTVFNLIENDSFKTLEQLKTKVNDLNKKAKSKLICGDALIELENIEDGTIDLIITDPPYGIDYKSNRSKYKKHVTKETIKNDGLDDSLGLLDSVCEVLLRKTKTDAHLYFCVGWQTEPQFRSIISKYFEIKNVIIWDKGNHGAGDLEYSWGNRYEMIIFAIKGNRKINKRADDIIQCKKLNSAEMIHPTQKPIDLIKSILDVSARSADTVCDPFMGSGSTIKAVKEYGSLNYIGVEIDRVMFNKASAFVGDSND